MLAPERRTLTKRLSVCYLPLVRRGVSSIRSPNGFVVCVGLVLGRVITLFWDDPCLRRLKRFYQIFLFARGPVNLGGVSNNLGVSLRWVSDNLTFCFVSMRGCCADQMSHLGQGLFNRRRSFLSREEVFNFLHFETYYYFLFLLTTSSALALSTQKAHGRIQEVPSSNCWLET